MPKPLREVVAFVWRVDRTLSLARDAVHRDAFAYALLQDAGLRLAGARAALRENARRLGPDAGLAGAVDRSYWRFRAGWTRRDERHWQWANGHRPGGRPVRRLERLLTVAGWLGDRRGLDKPYGLAHAATPREQRPAIEALRRGVNDFLDVVGARLDKTHAEPDAELLRACRTAASKLAPVRLGYGRESSRCWERSKPFHFALSVEDQIQEGEFIVEFRELTGFTYPPRNAAEWVTTLVRAGWTQQRSEQFLATAGYEGFEDVGKLPGPYVSTPGGETPIFTATMMAGLRRARLHEQLLAQQSPAWRQGPAPSDPPRAAAKRRRRRGPIARYDANHDRRIAEAWGTKRYKKYSELGQAFGISERQARLALDRVRKRRNNSA